MLPGVIEPWHLVIILIIALVIFGPGKLGDVGGALGRGIKEFRTSMTIEEGKEKTSDEKAAEAAKKESSDKASEKVSDKVS
ncbi:MAG TPA: twin-arginine translocase TatA/TatE family subunit [Chloroflexota bacterium]|nr:twin-arginine translocase TatA/TatE family subunit [Chloroflexota bacterium]